MALSKSGKRLTALRELHEAKVNWWHGDTVRHSILAMLYIAHLYSELMLPQAAKKYALAAGYAALHADDQRMRTWHRPLCSTPPATTIRPARGSPP